MGTFPSSETPMVFTVLHQELSLRNMTSFVERIKFTGSQVKMGVLYIAANSMLF